MKPIEPGQPGDAGETTFVFRWSGRYAGFFRNDWLFENTGRYLGWRDTQGRVWKQDGSLLGEVVGEHYILADRRMLPQRQIPRVPPVPALPPNPPPPRLPRLPQPSCYDPLEELLRLPKSEELVGEWHSESERLQFGEDGRFRWSAADASATANGHWELRERVLWLRWEESTEPNRPYWIIEFTGDSLLLRWIREQGHSLPFRLNRGSPERPSSTEGVAGEPKAL